MRRKRGLSQLLTAALVLAALALALPELGRWMGMPESSAPLNDNDPALEVLFLDVGQADCILARQGGHTVLVDAGGNVTAGQLVETLRELGVTRFDTVIGTHPHEDHIGGLDAVLRAFPTDLLIMPKIEHDTKTFRDVLDAVEERGLSVTTPSRGKSYAVGQASLTLLYDDIDPKNLNNCSVISRLTFAGRALLLTGDAEAEAEQWLLESGQTLRSDFLKVGHHGSNTSSTPGFLDAVRPAAAFIQCGADNSYQHPHATTVRKLEALCPDGYYRTDLHGTIRLMVQADGRYQITTEKGW